VESEAIYNLLQKVVAPLYYDRGPDGLPHNWIKMMKASIQKLVPHFNTNRMVREYYGKFYVPAHRATKKLLDNGRVQELSGWRRKVEENWPRVRVVLDNFKPEMEIHSGTKGPVRAIVWLGELKPEDVDVQIHVGAADGETVFKDGKSVSMLMDSKLGDAYVFTGEVAAFRSGRHDFAARVIPRHPDLVNPFMPFFIKWNEE
jgi:starch phosphorylase